MVVKNPKRRPAQKRPNPKKRPKPSPSPSPKNPSPKNPNQQPRPNPSPKRNPSLKSPSPHLLAAGTEGRPTEALSLLHQGLLMLKIGSTRGGGCLTNLPLRGPSPIWTSGSPTRSTPSNPLADQEGGQGPLPEGKGPGPGLPQWSSPGPRHHHQGLGEYLCCRGRGRGEKTRIGEKRGIEGNLI